MLKKEREAVDKFAETYARKKGYVLNPDREIYDMIIEGLVANKMKYRRQYCPCRPVTGNLKEDLNKICPCKWHEEEIERDGMCLCQLFLKPKSDI